ncbi:MAG: DUF4223 family protein [Rickettsiales bacterium]|jgi:hypothetical protein|nr:DUF4223 family protein [Rickettsiales bacterium]
MFNQITKESKMKKILIIALALTTLTGCVGMAKGRSRSTGKETYDVYLFHPIITISGYTSQM